MHSPLKNVQRDHRYYRRYTSGPAFDLGCATYNEHTDTGNGKLQALVYDILPSTTAVFSYAIGPTKLSANEQFFVGAQTVEFFFTNNSN